MKVGEPGMRAGGRVVSLIASATEMVSALGQGDRPVGRSHECDYPEAVRALPVCTGPEIDTEGGSAEIDRDVKALVGKALSVYWVDGELLKRLEPDVILTQSQCEVCAVTRRDLERAVGDWVDSAVRIVSLEPNALADVWADIGRVAEALGVPDRGAKLMGRLRRRTAAIAETAKRGKRRPTVACIEWIEPLMAAGNWVPELVEMAGGINLFGAAGKHAPWMTFEALKAADPEIVLVLPCGFDIARSTREMPALTARPGWTELRAVRDGRVFIADGNQYFNRPGPRLVDSLEILAELLHPELFRFHHEGTGWVRLRPIPTRRHGEGPHRDNASR